MSCNNTEQYYVVYLCAVLDDDNFNLDEEEQPDLESLTEEVYLLYIIIFLKNLHCT